MVQAITKMVENLASERLQVQEKYEFNEMTKQYHTPPKSSMSVSVVSIDTDTKSYLDSKRMSPALRIHCSSFDHDGDDHYETGEEEKRQDIDCVATDHTPRSSPRSPFAVLKLRRTNLFPTEEGQPTKPFTVTYSPSSMDYDDTRVSSRSIASSMFLVSPLRPLTRRMVSTEESYKLNSHILRAALIDSSESVLRPLTPPNPKRHRPKRSLSDANLIDNVDEDEMKSADDDDFILRRLAPALITKKQPQRQRQQPQPPTTKQRWLIPAEHPYKILWDVLTFILSFANVYATHTAIRDRQFGNSWFMSFCDAWFFCDILLNFITEYRSDNYALTDCRSVWARYLTTWFVVDVLSLFPGEALYLRPIIDQQNKRGFFKKSFFRTKAVVRVTRILRGSHFKMFGQVTKHSKHAGVGAARLLHLLIKYIPKYLLFFRNMKGVVAIRMLRQVHWFRKVWRNFIYKSLADDNGGAALPEKPPLAARRDYCPDYDDDDDDGAPF